MEKGIGTNGLWLKVGRWGILVLCWLLTAKLLGRAAGFAEACDYLRFGPEKFVGMSAVVYQEAPVYLYTNTISHHLKCIAAQWQIALLFGLMATVTGCIIIALCKQRSYKISMRILSGVVLLLVLLYLAVVCVWEWALALALVGLVLYVRLFPRLPWAMRFTVAALLASVALFVFQRRSLKWEERKCNAFWNAALQCVSVEDFTKAYGSPAISYGNMSADRVEWFNGLLFFDTDIVLQGKTLHGFMPPQMPNILLLPIFDDGGARIAFAWCYLTPERRDFLAKRPS